MPMYALYTYYSATLSSEDELDELLDELLLGALLFNDNNDEILTGLTLLADELDEILELLDADRLELLDADKLELLDEILELLDEILGLIDELLELLELECNPSAKAFSAQPSMTFNTILILGSDTPQASKIPLAVS
jgi:hypothetical protein